MTFRFENAKVSHDKVCSSKTRSYLASAYPSVIYLHVKMIANFFCRVILMQLSRKMYVKANFSNSVPTHEGGKDRHSCSELLFSFTKWRYLRYKIFMISLRKSRDENSTIASVGVLQNAIKNIKRTTGFINMSYQYLKKKK